MKTSTRARRFSPRVARFHLSHKALLGISVLQQSPVCRELGRYAFHAGGGTNIVRAPKRIRGHRLAVGTYRFVGSTAGKPVFDVRFRLANINAKLVTRRTHLSDVCAPRVPLIAALGNVGDTRSSSSPIRAAAVPAPSARPAQQTATERKRNAFLPPSLSAFDPTNAPSALRPVLFLLLAGAIGLLAAAAVPGSAAATGALGGVVRHRTTLTVTGLCLLVATALLTLFN